MMRVGISCSRSPRAGRPPWTWALSWLQKSLQKSHDAIIIESKGIYHPSPQATIPNNDLFCFFVF